LTCTSGGSSGSPTLKLVGSSTPAPVTSTITVPNTYSSYTVSNVTVTLDGVTTDGENYLSMGYAAFMLSSPSSQELEFLGGTGDGTDGDDNADSGSGLLNATIKVADGQPAAPELPNYWTPQSGTFSVKPSSYFYAADSQAPPIPSGASSGSSKLAQSDGVGTFNSQFVLPGGAPNGTWTLTLEDYDTYFFNAGNNPPGKSSPQIVSDPVTVNTWTLVLTLTPSSKESTTTSLSSSSTNNTSFTGGSNSSVTLTATVSP
jgi:hypothetical protein